MTMPHVRDCYYCIEGNQPAGTRRILGPVFRACTVCAPACELCEGHSVFPADFRCWHCMSLVLLFYGLQPVACPVCGGLVDLVPADPTDQAGQVVSPHED